MYYRTYFDRDNVIIKDSDINLGANPVAELFYGGTESNPTYSRYIFHFDESYLIQKYNQCELPLAATTHVLKLKPTHWWGDGLERCIASQYTLCLWRIPQDWVEGMGYTWGCEDHCSQVLKNQCSDSLSASNWTWATPTTPWDTPGVINNLSGDTIYLECINVGSQEDCDWISFDMTTIVNDLITGDTLNYGFGISLHSTFELFPQGQTKYMGFYTRDTETFYEPHLETHSESQILDNRGDFYSSETNQLYLSLRRGGTGVTLDTLPLVTILDSDDSVVLTTTGECVGKGLYRATIEMTGTSCIYYDRWDSTVSGKTLSITQEFEVLTDTPYQWDTQEDKKFGFKFRGIDRGEKILNGDTRRLFIDAYEEFQKKKVSIGAEYRIYKKEGQLEHQITPWEVANKLDCDVFVDIDTSWMIKGLYYLDIKINNDGIIRTYPEPIWFEVINKNTCT